MLWCEKAVLRVLEDSSGGKWATSRAPDPIDEGVAVACLWLPRAWGTLELQKIHPPCLCYLDGEQQQISWLHLTRPLELPSEATLCPGEADVALARATGL